jgi:transaldolase
VIQTIPKQFKSVIIETPRESRNEYPCDPRQKDFGLKKVLPAGMTLPYHFGFIPSTKAEDGDPVDVLAIMDEPAFPGCILKCRVVGVTEGERGKKMKTERNDRAVAVKQEKHSYGRVPKSISPLVGDAGVSIEVFLDLDSTAEQMLAQGKEMFAWIPNAYVKYPCTREGLRAANMSIKGGIRVNMTLCFSQEQAAVYAATMGSPAAVYVSPFIGRLDDGGVNGVDLVKKIRKMYERGDHHVHVLAAGLRHIHHLLFAFHFRAALATAPSKMFEEWTAMGYPVPDQRYPYKAVDGENKPPKPIEGKELDLDSPWESFDLAHELTTNGIQKFVAGYESTLKRSA